MNEDCCVENQLDNTIVYIWYYVVPDTVLMKHININSKNMSQEEVFGKVFPVDATTVQSTEIELEALCTSTAPNKNVPVSSSCTS